MFDLHLKTIDTAKISVDFIYLFYLSLLLLLLLLEYFFSLFCVIWIWARNSIFGPKNHATDDMMRLGAVTTVCIRQSGVYWMLNFNTFMGQWEYGISSMELK